MRIHLLLIIISLLQNGCSKGKEPENILIDGDLKMLKKLINKGELKTNSKITNNEMSLLSFAISYQHIDIVEYLLQNGANIDAKDKMGFTAYESLQSLINQSGHYREININKWMEIGSTREEAERRAPAIDQKGRKFDQEGHEKWLKIKALLDKYKAITTNSEENKSNPNR
jgi:hypothetical protein